MEELELFKKRMNSLLNKALDGGVSVLNFLDEAKLVILKNESKKFKDINVFYYGGFKNADSLRAIISPYDIEKEDFKIIVFKIIYNEKYYNINHRSVLGSLMALGIKREFIGDIVLNDTGIYFACAKEISDFIYNNLKKVGSASITLKYINEEIENVIKYKEKIDFLSSLRLDCFISSAFDLSRSKANELIVSGLVYINHVLILNPSETIKLEDEISVRGKGRCKLAKIGGLSKSNRIAVTLAKRI